MQKHEAETIIIDAFKRFGIQDYSSSFEDLSDDFIKDCAFAIIQIEEQFKDKDFENCDVLTLMDFKHCSYNGQVYLEVYNVIRMIYEGGFNSDIATSLKISPSHVELIQYLLCDKGLADYGTSPRGCWLSGNAKPLFLLMSKYQTIIDQNTEE